MNLIGFHILHAGPSADFGVLRYAVPAGDGEQRVLLWEGLAPSALADHANVAPVVAQGDVEGHRAYAERIPRGLPLSEVQIPISRSRWVALGALRGLEAIHQQEQTHGNISAERLYLGTQGEVLWVGRGRRDGDAFDDLDGLRDLLRKLNVDLSGGIDGARAGLERDIDPVDAAVVGSIVADALHEPPWSSAARVFLQVGPGSESLDEVVPDFGPDTADEPGLLDHWSSRTPRDPETTGERTAGEVRLSDSSLALTLWTRLGAPPEHPAPPGRFDGLGFSRSSAILELLRAETPDGLPVILGGDVGPFLLAAPEGEVGERTDPAFGTSDLEITPGTQEDEGDTAIYDRREQRLRDAIRGAEQRTSIAMLEARLLEAERRAREAERRLLASSETLPTPAAPPPAWQPEAGLLEGFLRAEVVAAAAIGALAMWLVLRAFGLA